jgi:hypothetical protein
MGPIAPQGAVQGDAVADEGRLLGDEAAGQTLGGTQLGQYGQVVVEPLAITLHRLFECLAGHIDLTLQAGQMLALFGLAHQSVLDLLDGDEHGLAVTGQVLGDHGLLAVHGCGPASAVKEGGREVGRQVEEPVVEEEIELCGAITGPGGEA